MSYTEDSVGIIGGGYVGLVSGACFSALGFDVTIVELDPAKLESLRQGRVPIYEPGLNELVHDGIAAGRLSFVGKAEELFRKSIEVVFIAVGTPQNADGSCDMSFVDAAVKSVVEAPNRKDLVVVLKSTVPVGTARRLAGIFAGNKHGQRTAFVNNPEFLTEGNAVADFMRPSRVVLGGSEDWAVAKVKSLYDSLLNNGHPLFVADHETAELAKLSANLMLASRVSLINQVSRLSAKTGADIRAVESILRSDPRIGPKYLYSGLGYGGSCFPKDVKNFIHLCREAGVDASMAEAVDQFNTRQKLYFMDPIRARFPKANATTVALLGVAFKPNTDDIRESPALALTRALRDAGYAVKAYDPRAAANFRGWLKSEKIEGVEICETPEAALGGADVAAFVTEWQEFQRITPTRLKQIFRGKLVLDGKNILKPQAFKAAGFEYLGVGRA